MTFINLILTDYKDILFNTARIFSSVFEIVLAYILVNNFFTSRFKKKHVDVLLFAGLAAGIIFLLERDDGALLRFRYPIELAALTAILFFAFAGSVRRKIVGAMVFAVLIAVSQIGSHLLFSLAVSRLDPPPDLGSPYMQLTVLTAANLILILLTVLLSILSKRVSKGAASLRLWTALLAVPAFTLVTF